MTVQLPFGLSSAVPDSATVAWGARLIVGQDGYVDFVPDRQGVAGEAQLATGFLQLLTDEAPLDHLLAAVRNLLAEGRMHTRRAEDFMIFRSDKVEVHANTNASAGYCYLAAFPTPQAATPVVEIVDGAPVIRSSCCGAEVDVQREVHDLVRFTPERLADGRLLVRYRTVDQGAGTGSSDIRVTCSDCGRRLDADVEEAT